MTVTTKDILIRARTILDEKGWTQNRMARDKDGREVLTTDSRATRFCALGAVHKATSELRKVDNTVFMGVAVSMLDAVAARRGHSGIVSMNDDFRTTKNRVLEVFDQAIDRAGSS